MIDNSQYETYVIHRNIQKKHLTNDIHLDIFISNEEISVTDRVKIGGAIYNHTEDL